jgi:hypothetical protein
MTKWRSGVEIDLQTTLAHAGSRPKDNQTETGRGLGAETTLPDVRYDPGKDAQTHTVSIRPAYGLESEFEETEWTDATESEIGTGSLRERSTYGRSSVRVSTVHRVSEESQR